MVFGRSALNRVYNFKRVGVLIRAGSVLDSVWLQDCRLVFGRDPRSETFTGPHLFRRSSAKLDHFQDLILALLFSGFQTPRG